MKYLKFSNAFSDDLFGKILAIFSMVPLWIISIFTGLILRCRDLHTVSTIPKDILYFPPNIHTYA